MSGFSLSVRPTSLRVDRLPGEAAVEVADELVHLLLLDHDVELEVRAGRRVHRLLDRLLDRRLGAEARRGDRDRRVLVEQMDRLAVRPLDAILGGDGDETADLDVPDRHPVCDDGDRHAPCGCHREERGEHEHDQGGPMNHSAQNGRRRRGVQGNFQKTTSLNA